MTQARILIVDSNVGAITDLQDILSEDGYDVSSVRDPQDAGGYLERKAVDLILTDLPAHTDGLSYLRHLRGRCPATPIVLMTAFGTTETMTVCTGFSADTPPERYLTKWCSQCE